MTQKSFGSTAELITNLANAAGESSTSTRARAKILAFLNIRYQNILAGRNWRFLHSELWFDLKAPYTTGTVSTTQGSTSVTGTGTAWTNDIVNQKLAVGGSGDLPEIQSVDTVNQIITLKSPWTEESVTNGAHQVLYDTYTRDESIDSITKGYINGSSPNAPEIKLVGFDTFRQRQKGSFTRKGLPRYLTAYSIVESGDVFWTLEVWPAPEKAYTVLLHYDAAIAALVDSDTNYSLIPNKYQHVLYYATLCDLLDDQKYPNQARAAQKKFQSAYMKFTGDYEMTDNRNRITREKNYFERARARSRFHYGRNYKREDVNFD